MVMVKFMGVPATLVLFVILAMVVGSAQAAATSCPQFPLSCVSYILDGQVVPKNDCCIEVQKNFQLLKPTARVQSYCEAINGVKLCDGPLARTQLTLALGLPQTCASSGQYKEG